MKKTLGITAAVGAGLIIIGGILYFAAVLMGGRGKEIVFDNGWSLYIGRGGFSLSSDRWDEAFDFLDWDDWDEEEYYGSLEKIPASSGNTNDNAGHHNGMTPITPGSGEADFSGNVERINVSLAVTDFDVKQSRTDKAWLQWENISDYGQISYKMENGVLTIEEQAREENIGGIFNGNDDRKVTLYLPGGPQPELVMALGVGDVDLENVSFRNVSCAIGTGDFDAENVEAESLELASGMGDVDGENLRISGATTISCGMGDAELSLRGKQADHSYDLSTEMGDVRLNQQSVSNHYQETTNGEAPLVKITNGMGDISLRVSE